MFHGPLDNLVFMVMTTVLLMEVKIKVSTGGLDSCSLTEKFVGFW